MNCDEINFIVVQWIHTGAFGVSNLEARAKWGDCVDADERCGSCPRVCRHCRVLS